MFSNGAVLTRTDEDLQQPVILTEHAEAGQKFLIAVRVNAGNVETVLRRAELLVEPPANRPDPNFLREQILSAQPIIGAYEDGRAEREQQLAAAVEAIDFSALEHDDQTAFDGSLGQARTRLEALNPWLKQFTVHAVGNSHIDMAWLWPWTETVEVVRNTFQSVLDLMRVW